MGTVFNYEGIAKRTPADLQAFERAASIIDVHPNWLGAVFQLESGWNPAAVNPQSGASGLIQFMPKGSALALGTTAEALRRMSFQEQLPYVIRYFGEKAGLRSLEDTYLKVFYPSMIGRPLETVISKAGEKVYEQNRLFDNPPKGYITVGDVTSTIRAVYNRGKARGEVTIPLA